MNRRRILLWLLALPVMLAGSQVAHALAYRIVYPGASERLHELLLSGHSYLAYLPVVLSIGGAVELLALAVIAVDAARRRAHRPLPAWAFAVVPALGFVLQEFSERWLDGASFPWWAVLQPTFRVGLLLQLPVGFLAYAIARLLQRAAETVGTALAPEPLVLLRAHSPHLRPVVAVVPRRRLRLAGSGPRGPPGIAA